MRTIIAGTRTYNDYSRLLDIIKDLKWNITTVLSGGSLGVDEMRERWARSNDIPIEYYAAQWGKYGKSAGPRRNLQMAQNADSLITLWDGSSRGTQNMIQTAQDLDLQVHIVRI